VLFVKYLRDGVRSGAITNSVRVWQRPHVKAGNRYRHEVRVRAVAGTVGVGELSRLGEKVRRRDRMRRRLIEALPFQQPQDLQHGDAAGARRPHRADAIATIGRTHRLSLDSAITGKVLEREIAAACRSGAHDGLGDFAPVKRAAVLRQLAQCRCIGLVDDPPSTRVVKRSRFGILAKEALALEHAAKAMRDVESTLGDANRRREQLAPREPPVLRVGELEHRQDAGNADRTPAHRRFHEAERLLLGIEEAIGARGRRRQLATVVGAQLLLALRPVEEKRAAADTGGFRFDQAEHQLHRDRGVDRGAAAREDLDTRLDRERMRRRDDEAVRGLRVAGRRKKEKGDRSRPSQRRHAKDHTIKGTTSSATMLMILISGLTAGPAVSL